jgi:hypothetical protein
MKRTLLCSLIVLTIASFYSHANAQWVTKDSANGLIYGLVGEPFAQLAEGPPDSRYCPMDSTSASTLDMGFSRDTAKHRWLPILPNARLVIYGKKDPQKDSSALSLRFYRILPDFSQGPISREYIVNPGITTIIVPDTQYTYIEMTLTGGGSTHGSHGFLLDAITLFQNFDGLGVGQFIAPIVSALANYPNPFTAQMTTNINVHLERPGTATVVIADAIGRELSRNVLGAVGPGDHAVLFHAPAAGVYYARLMLNGAFSGQMLKMSALR